MLRQVSESAVQAASCRRDSRHVQKHLDSAQLAAAPVLPGAQAAARPSLQGLGHCCHLAAIGRRQRQRAKAGGGASLAWMACRCCCGSCPAAPSSHSRHVGSCGRSVLVKKSRATLRIPSTCSVRSTTGHTGCSRSHAWTHKPSCACSGRHTVGIHSVCGACLAQALLTFPHVRFTFAHSLV